jgi:hypothetical protein
MAFAMGWEILWPLILGFTLSAVIQAVVSHREMAGCYRMTGRVRLQSRDVVRDDQTDCNGALPLRTRADDQEKGRMVAVTRELPTTGYALEVDGRLKTEFETKEGA